MKRFLLIVLFVFVGQCLRAGVNEIRIFGEVFTVTNTKVVGYISWGKNSLYWVNLFTAFKIGNPYISFLEEKRDILFKNGTETKPRVHAFSCRFGNIMSIRPIAADRIELQVKSGDIIELQKGDFDDIGGEIHVEREDGKIIRVPWEIISEVRFRSAPVDFPAPKDIPITGVVTTPYGKFKGIVQWNRDANSLQDMLWGMIGKPSVSIAFLDIKSIRKEGTSCIVNLKSGRDISLWGTSNVNYKNRGTLIQMASVGQVCVEWPDFSSFEAVGMDEIKLMGYDDFPKPRRLFGKIESRDKRVMEGVFVYDLDEAMDFELLDGRNGNIIYSLPFRYVKKIEPKNYEYSWVELKNGTKLVLGKYSDVNAENEGILFFQNDQKPEYFRWREIRQISFDVE